MLQQSGKEKSSSLKTGEGRVKRVSTQSHPDVSPTVSKHPSLRGVEPSRGILKKLQNKPFSKLSETSTLKPGSRPS